MINQTNPVFIPVYNPQGCGENHQMEYVNANNISRIVPSGYNGYTVYYETSNAAGALRHCTGEINSNSLKNLDIIG